MNDLHDVHLLSGAYAVGALDDLERVRFEAHLETCADCRAEVAGLVDTTALLAETTAVAPPSHLRDAVLAGISTVRPLPPEVSRISTTSAAPEAPRRRWFPALAAAAAVVAVIGVGVVVYDQVATDETSQRDITATDRVIGAPDAQSYEQRIDGATATVVVSREQGKAVIIAEDMPAAPSGKVYELWLMTPEEEFVPAGLMPGGSEHRMLLEGDATDSIAVGITVEPQGGSDQPTTDPIVMFELA